MKTTNKLFIALVLAMLSFSFTYADDSATWCTLSWTTTPKKEFMKNCNSYIKDTMKNQKQAVKDNLSNFKQEYGKLVDYLSWATEEQKASLETLKNNYKTSIESLKDDYEAKIASWATLEEKQAFRDELQTKLQELWTKYFDDMLLIIWESNTQLKAYIEARKQVFLTNSETRKDWLQARQDLRNERKEAVLSYKEKFISKVWTHVEGLAKNNPEKLEEISNKIENLIEKYNSSTKLTQTQKEKIVSQLEALQEMIKEIQDTQSVLDETTWE